MDFKVPVPGASYRGGDAGGRDAQLGDCLTKFNERKRKRKVMEEFRMRETAFVEAVGRLAQDERLLCLSAPEDARGEVH